MGLLLGSLSTTRATINEKKMDKSRTDDLSQKIKMEDQPPSHHMPPHHLIKTSIKVAMERSEIHRLINTSIMNESVSTHKTTFYNDD